MISSGSNLLRLLAWVCLLSGPGLAGCTRTVARDAGEAPLPVVMPVVLAAGDVVEFKFPYAPELNDTQAVRPDGFVSLQLVGEVQTAGLTPAALAEALRESYAEHLRQPEVTVILRESYGRRVFVGGEVRQPGVVALPGVLTVMDALTLAGGLDLESAAVAHVLVMRRTADNSRVAYRVDLRPALRGADTTPFLLEPEDHVYVPRTAVVNVNQFMRQYVAGVVPRTGFVVARSVGSTTYGLDTSGQ